MSATTRALARRRWARVGRGPGAHGSVGGGGSTSAGSVEVMVASIAAARPPSATQWWILVMKATRPSARPSATHTSQSG